MPILRHDFALRRHFDAIAASAIIDVFAAFRHAAASAATLL